MEKYVINGGTPLRGEVEISGAKNAAVAIIPAALMALDMDDALLANMLGAYGIPCVKQYPNDGQFGKLILGMSGTGVDVYVPKSMLEDALTLCEGVPDDENL